MLIMIFYIIFVITQLAFTLVMLVGNVRILRLSLAPFRSGLLLVALGQLTNSRERVADESRSCSGGSDATGIVVSGSLNKI